MAALRHAAGAHSTVGNSRDHLRVTPARQTRALPSLVSVAGNGRHHRMLAVRAAVSGGRKICALRNFLVRKSSFAAFPCFLDFGILEIFRFLDFPIFGFSGFGIFCFAVPDNWGGFD